MKHVVWSLIFVLTLVFAGGNTYAQNAGAGVRVIVIDAGHGGSFPGAIYSKVKEKDLNL